MDNTSEIYIYLGYAQSTYFYIHIVESEKFTDSISSEIYNVMIKSEYIEHSEQNVIIYDFNSFTNKNKIIAIQHFLKDKHYDFGVEDLAEFLPKLLVAERNDLFAIKYNYVTTGYNIYNLDNFDFTKFIGKIPKESAKFSEIVNMRTKYVM